MAIGDDFSVVKNGAAYDIRWTGTTGTYTLLAFCRWLQSLGRQLTSSGDDNYDITVPTLINRKTDQIFELLNGANIDDTAAEHLYAGSITQGSGAVGYYGLAIVGSLAYASTEIQIAQNNAFLTRYWGTGLNAAPSQNVLCQLLIKARTGGADIDGKRIRVQSNELGYEFAYFNVTLAEGISTAALFSKADNNNQTAAATIAGWTDITVTEGYQTIDVGDGNGAQPYFQQWDKGSRTLNNVYERTKWLQRRGTSSTIHGINAGLFLGITHRWAYDGESGGPFAEDEIISWGTGVTAGTGLLLGLDDDGATGNMYIQLLTGVAPSNDLTITGGTSSATCAVNGTVTSSNPPGNFFGQFTGTAIIGAYGIGVDPADLTASDKVTDLTGTERTPPNNQSGSLTSLEIGVDTVYVFPTAGAGSTTLAPQYTLAAGNNSGNATLVIKETIANAPSSGTVRVWYATANKYVRIPYASRTGSTFTLTGTLPYTFAENAAAFVSYIDKSAASTTESFTMVFGSAVNMAALFRAENKKDFLTPVVFGATGFTQANIAGSDL